MRNQTTVDYDKHFVPLYKRDATVFTHGKGCRLYDTTGKSYLDFSTGIAVNTLGHGHPVLKKVLQKQGEALLHLSNLYHMPSQLDLAAKLVKHSFGTRVFFCNSGTEANEAAIKFARRHIRATAAKKYNILSFTDGFHGRTYGSLSATAQAQFHKGFDPLIKGFHYTPFNNLSEVKKVFAKYAFAAVIVEPLQGEGGVNAADKTFITGLRNLCNDHGALLIFDEIQCGFGRTGTLWNYEQYKVTPDIMTLAKPLGGGLPLGAVVTTEAVAQSMHPGDHGTTFGGNPVACALGSAVLETVSQKSFLKDVRKKGTYLKKQLTLLQKEFPVIKAVRGSGLLIGVQMKEDPTGIIAACKEKGLLLVKAGHNTVRFLPPLIVTQRELDRAVSLFTSVLKKNTLKG